MGISLKENFSALAFHGIFLLTVTEQKIIIIIKTHLDFKEGDQFHFFYLEKHVSPK